VVVTRTFSKMYGLAALRVGYGVAQPAVIDILNRVREPFNVNALAQGAAVAALQDRAYYARIADDIEAQRRFLYRALTALGVEYVESFTNFILVRTGSDGTKTAQALLKKGVIVRDMSAWGLKGYIRVSLGTSAENKRFIKTLGAIL
jgi:histidinol-phosphate aminotransferase